MLCRRPTRVQLLRCPSYRTYHLNTPPRTYRLELGDISLTTPNVRIRQRLDPPVPDRNPCEYPTRLDNKLENVSERQEGEEGILRGEIFVEQVPNRSDCWCG